MYAGQTLKTNKGVEILLFPLDEMYITQGENGSISHVLAMDFVGWSNSTGQINKYPFYAPCSLICVEKKYTNSQAYIIYNSVSEVLRADGSIGKISIVVMHDDAPIYNVGDTVNQGALLGHTGTSGYATGDHTHFNVANGDYVGWDNLGNGFSELTNSMHLYNAFFVNDTTIYNGYGYDWKTYTGATEPDIPIIKNKRKKRAFKWQIYTNYFYSRR